MVRVFRWLSLILVLSPLLLFAFGILFWASAARPEGFFVFEAIRARSIVSFWLYDKSEKDFSKQIDMSVFVWIRPSQIGSALTSFDDWFQEYLLIIEDTDEAADGAPYILPPAIIPPFQIESSFEPDQYDSVMRKFIEDIWSSGFFSVAGFIQPETNLWLKSVLGWHSAGVGLESLAKVFGLSPRTAEKGIIHPFFLTWLNRQPSAELERDTKDGLTVYESVLEVSADELFVLHGKLCWLGSIPDRLCSDGSFFDNPIDPFLRVSKVFKVQLKYFWTVRGGALLWSNRKECLGSAFSKSGTRFAGCVDRKPSSVKSLFEHNSALRLHKALTSQQRDSFGLFVNEEQLLTAFDAVVDSFGKSEKLQSEWLSDLLVQADTLRDLRNLSNSLKLRSQLIPFWGARLVENGPGSLELLTVARWNGMDEHLEKIQRDWAESQFEFLYSLKTAWSGLPRTRGRFRQSGPWRQIAEFRQSKSLFEIGWSDRE